ncbi:MAG: orotate phosphoribosyltransferase [Deltaproteobacteria bacterium]|nr:orotate phosphoribosyltransferase [Deltaproteobacteria bacterium]
MMKLLEKFGAVLTNGHFVYTSGKHGSAYINKDALYPHTTVISRLCRELAKKFSRSPVEVVVAPVVGGVILSQWVAHHLSRMKKREVLGVYAEKSADGFILKRGYDRLVSGKKVLVVEDILNTGGSAKKVVETVRSAGGVVIGVGALVNRGGVIAKDLGGVPKVFSLVELPLEAWEANECPLCVRQLPINTEVGKGKR